LRPVAAYRGVERAPRSGAAAPKAPALTLQAARRGIVGIVAVPIIVKKQHIAGLDRTAGSKC
jgi:hypothetical protein